MKVLIDARMYGLEHSGIGRYISNLVQEFINLKIDEQFIILLKKKYFDALEFPKDWAKVLADFRHYTLNEQLLLPGIINKEKPDLVHFPHINIPIFYRGPFVVTVHDMTMHFQGTNATTLPLYKYLLKRLPYKFIFRSAVKRSCKIITPSKSIKKEITDYFMINPNKIAVTYEGLTNNFVESGTHKDESAILSSYGLKSSNYFFYVGNSYPHKNLDLVVRAISSLNKESSSKVIFAIAGSRDIFVRRLEDLIRREHATLFIKVLGYIPDDDLRVLYKNSIAFVYPSFSEGFGLQGLEAMASGSLILVSDIPVFREVYENNALFFDPRSISSVTEIMKRVMKVTPNERSTIISKSIKFIARYSWQKTAMETFEIYKKVIKQRQNEN